GGGGGDPPGVPAVRPLDGGAAQRGEPAPFLDPGGLRTRLRGAVGTRAGLLPVHRALRPVRGRGHPLERRHARDRLAGGRAGAVGEGREGTLPRRYPAGAAAVVRAMRILLLGANGQPGPEPPRPLAPPAEVAGATRAAR